MNTNILTVTHNQSPRRPRIRRPQNLPAVPFHSPSLNAPFTPDFSTLTRDELYIHAQHLNISGRSTMTKQQLLEAITNA